MSYDQWSVVAFLILNMGEHARVLKSPWWLVLAGNICFAMLLYVMGVFSY